jgi:flavin reductase (DIM6/NTAB) family NADH-FMN oxidoreductase RutF
MINFKRINPEEIDENVIDLIGKQWMLITAGSSGSYNTMTASWGGMGMLWNKPVVFIFIRPQRFTFGFAESNGFFTCSFFSKQYRKALNFCGSHSGRDYDKAAETGLSPMTTESGSVAFAEANLVIECRKIYFQDLNPEGFLSPDIIKNYPEKDFHRMYIGEITYCGMKVKSEE